MRKVAPEVLVRRGHAYRRAGSFMDRCIAVRYKNQALHSLLVVGDDPKRFGVDVRYHVYRRID